MGPDLRETFLSILRASVAAGTFVKLTLGKPRGTKEDLQSLHVRPVTLRGTPHLSLVWRHKTKDITKNFAPIEAVTQITALVGTDFHSAHLFATDRSTQLEFNKKGEPRLGYGPAAAAEAATTHDRAKERMLPPESQAWLEALGVTNPAGVVRTGMADKYRQIHKFVEILSHLAAETKLPADRPVEIADMGCGKGYLTFATHDYFNRVLNRAANVTGLEARPELVKQCTEIARSSGCARLVFQAGTIQSAPEMEVLDVLIALHACDTATDDALARGVQAGAALIVASPCCQKELRPQLQPAPVLAPALRHGIFQERHAEFVTDALRALLLEWAGYETKVFEFISTEHTARNLMITATKHAGPKHTAEAAGRIRELAAFYGIKEQALARHFGFALTS